MQQQQQGGNQCHVCCHVTKDEETGLSQIEERKSNAAKTLMCDCAGAQQLPWQAQTTLSLPTWRWFGVGSKEKKEGRAVLQDSRIALRKALKDPIYCPWPGCSSRSSYGQARVVCISSWGMEWDGPLAFGTPPLRRGSLIKEAQGGRSTGSRRRPLSTQGQQHPRCTGGAGIQQQQCNDSSMSSVSGPAYKPRAAPGQHGRMALFTSPMHRAT